MNSHMQLAPTALLAEISCVRPRAPWSPLDHVSEKSGNAQALYHYARGSQSGRQDLATASTRTAEPGGTVPDRPGAYYPATVLTDVAPGMPAYDDELFGPVAAIIPVDSEQEAIRVANDTVFGLGAAIFSRDVSV